METIKLNQDETTQPEKSLVTQEVNTSSIDKAASTMITQIEKSMSNQQLATDFKEGGKSIAHVMMTAEALNGSNEENQSFLKDIKEQKQKELKQSFLGEKFKEEAKKLEAKQQKAEAFYTNVRPILEFDFSPLIPKNPKTSFRKKQDGVLPAQEPPAQAKPTYKDRSYGIPLMILMLVLLTLPYCAITIVLAVGNGINAIFNGIARFGKPALIICGTIVGIVISILTIYCICRGVDILFGTEIISTIFKK